MKYLDVAIIIIKVDIICLQEIKNTKLCDQIAKRYKRQVQEEEGGGSL
jgi:hypothetical protein